MPHTGSAARADPAQAAPGSAPRLLLVEDNRGDAVLIREMIREWPLEDSAEVVHVTSLGAALGRLAPPPTCVLLDLGLPDADGLDVVREVRAADPSVPIIVLTGRDDDDTGAESLRCGAQDYLVKGQVTGRMLKRCIHQAVERMRMEAGLQQMALHDPLTGASNRVLFLNRLEAALSRARRQGTPAAVMMIDLDRFKEVNDRHGHAAGDELLRVISRRMHESIRSEDTLARLGGDEFAILCEDVHEPEEILGIARRLLGVIARPVTLVEGVVWVEASVGVAFAEPGQHPDAVLRNADHAMYRAKRAGHGRFEVHDPSSPVDS